MSLRLKSLGVLAILLAAPAWADAPAADELVPPGAHVLDRASGDLNGDQRQDEAIVYETPRQEGDAERTLVIGLRDAQGHLRPVATSKLAVLCKRCGGVFGDPFEGIKIQGSTLVINHYGGSRDRWGYRDRLMCVDGRWVWIGMTDYLSDALNGDEMTRDEDLWTGLVIETTTIQHATHTLAFHELRAGPLGAGFRFGDHNKALWTTPGISLMSADDVVAGRTHWHDRTSLAAHVQAGFDDRNLYVRAELTGSQAVPGAGLRMRTALGRLIVFDKIVRWKSAHGATLVARVPLTRIGGHDTLNGIVPRNVRPGPAVTAMVPLTLEVTNGPIVLSTNRSGADGWGYLRLSSKAGYPTLADLNLESRIADVPPAWDQRNQ